MDEDGFYTIRFHNYPPPPELPAKALFAIDWYKDDAEARRCKRKWKCQRLFNSFVDFDRDPHQGALLELAWSNLAARSACYSPALRHKLATHRRKGRVVPKP